MDDSKPFPASLQLIADALLQREGIYYNYSSHSARVEGKAARSKFRKTLVPLAGTLEYILNNQSSSNYPRTEEQFYSTLALHGIRLDNIQDPWGNAYRVKFEINRDKYKINISSDGPDERPGTRDDFNLIAHSKPFFEPAYIKEVETAFDAFKSNRGHYPRKADEFLAELRARSAALLSARDPWGAPDAWRQRNL